MDGEQEVEPQSEPGGLQRASPKYLLPPLISESVLSVNPWCSAPQSLELELRGLAKRPEAVCLSDWFVRSASLHRY